MTKLTTGDTLRVTDPGGSYDSHLWIVLSKFMPLDHGQLLIDQGLVVADDM